MNPCNLNQLGITREASWAVGHFNIHNHEFIKAVITAADKEKSPAILAVGMMSIQYMGLEPLVNACRIMSKETQMPIAVHLDHARELDTVKQALECGINSVMFDGSALDYEENVAKTIEVVKMAHDYGATAEGEVGIVPHEIGQLKQSDITDPLIAAEFAERTGVDFLAVSLGSVHGMKTAETRLNQGLLRELHQQVKVPLVLHGASGVVDEHIQSAVANGIRKINVNTGLKVVLKEHLIAHLPESRKSDLLEDLKTGMDAITGSIIKRMRLFNSSNKAYVSAKTGR